MLNSQLASATKPITWLQPDGATSANTLSEPPTRVQVASVAALAAVSPDLAASAKASGRASLDMRCVDPQSRHEDNRILFFESIGKLIET